MGDAEVDGTAAEGEEAVEVRSAERLLLFTDAVAAIAITLLILPLVDLVPEVAAEHGHAQDVILEHKGQIGSFLLSFVVIARLWLSHHRVFATVRTYNQALVLCNLGWLLAIVVLPFPTEMIGTFGHERFVSAFYSLNILAGMAFQTGMEAVLRRNPEMLRGGAREFDHYLADGIGNVCALAVAFLIALAVPALQYYSLLLLTVVSPVVGFWESRTSR